MLLDFDIPKSDHGVENQRLATNIVTSQSFIVTVQSRERVKKKK